MTFRDR